MKKISIFLSVIFVMLSFGGCRETTKITEKGIVEAIGIDFDGTNYTVSILAYRSQNIDEQSEDTTDTYVFSSPSISEAIASIPTVSGRIPFYANNRVIVIGADAAKEKLTDMINFFSRDNQMRADAYLLYADTTANDILNDEEFATPLNNNYIFGLLKKSVSNGKCAVMTVMNAKTCLDFKTGDVFMPVVTLIGEEKKKEVKIEKTIIFRENTVAATLDEKSSMALLLMRSELENPVITVKNNDETVSVEILKIGIKLIPDEDLEKISLTAKIQGKCEISEKQNAGAQTQGNEKIKSMTESYFSEICRDMFSESANKGRSDPAGIGRYLRKYQYESWKSFCEDRTGFLENAEISVSASLTIVRTGQLK